MDKFNVQIGNAVVQYDAGTSYHEIASDYQKDYENDIVLVMVNGKLQELHK